MLKPYLIAPAVFLLVHSLGAQASTVSPARFANANAPGISLEPFHGLGPTTLFRQNHWQEIHDLPATANGMIRGLAYRRPGNLVPDVLAHWVELEIALSTATTNSRTATTTFAANEGKDRMVVVQKKRINFPGMTHRGRINSAQPFLLKIPFDRNQPFNFKGGSLCIDIKVYDNNLSQSGSSNVVFLNLASNDRTGLWIPDGRGCYSSDTSNSQPFTTRVSAPLDFLNPNVINYSALTTDSAPGALAMHLITAKRHNGLGIPLAGGCYMSVDLSGLLISMASKPEFPTSRRHYFPQRNASAAQYLKIPFNDATRGLTIYTQSVALDAKANSMGFITSGLIEVVLPRFDKNGIGVSKISASRGDFTNATGRLSLDQALVTSLVR